MNTAVAGSGTAPLVDDGDRMLARQLKASAFSWAILFVLCGFAGGLWYFVVHSSEDFVTAGLGAIGIFLSGLIAGLFLAMLGGFITPAQFGQLFEKITGFLERLLRTKSKRVESSNVG